MGDDYCAVCADKLEWIAYGPCGHQEACSKCVTRLRFVLKDNRCVICQQATAFMFATKFHGQFSKTLSAQEFEEMKSGDRHPKYRLLKAADTFFDDKDHFEEMRQLCSYTHPVLAQEQAGGDAPSHFRSMKDLKHALQSRLHLQFCPVCLESRKVFISEQILYTRADLTRHMRSGDVEGAMAESGFKGHPQCKFCNKHFFGESELFTHMQQAHEQCHICKKAHPDRFIYYKDYNDLEEHFRHEHFLCGHPICLEKKFMVFQTEQELKQHNARDHAGSMSRAERRQALTIPIDISYSRQRVEEANAPRRGRGSQVRLREPDTQQLATALQMNQQENLLQASMDSARHQQLAQRDTQGVGAGEARRELDDADFPSMGGSEATAFGPGYTAFSQRAAPRPEDFPALPGTSKSARRKAREKQQEQEARSLAARVGSQGEVRVVNPGRAAASSSREESFPALGGGTARPYTRNPSPGQQWQPQPSAATQSTAPKPAGSDFPSLPQKKHTAIQTPTFPSQTYTTPGCRASAAPPQSGRPGRSSRPDDFPALRVGGSGDSRQENGGAGSSSRDPERQQTPAEEAAASGRGISEGLKAANKVLIERVKKQLDAKKFAEFRQCGGAFLRGEMDAAAYHKEVVSLGLSHLVVEMAVLLPDPAKKAQLLAAHEAAASAAPSTRYVPPEAAAAALAAAKTQGSWQCQACTLINEPRAATCEACSAKRPMHSLGSLSRGAAPATSLGNGDAVGGGSGAGSEVTNGKNPKKVGKFERLRLTSGGHESGLHAELERRTKPQNVWTQRSGPASSTSGPKTKNAWGL